MVDVVGLRFITDGEQEAVAALRRYAQVQTRVSDAAQSNVAALNRMQAAVRTLRGGLTSGAVSQESFAESLREIKRQYAALSGGSIQRASAEIGRFNQMLAQQEEARAFEAARMDFEALAASVDPAMEAVQRFESAMQRLNAAQAQNAVNDREFAAVQGRLREQLDSVTGAARRQAEQGLSRLRASIDPTEAAAQRLAAAQRTVDAAVEQQIISLEEGRRVMSQFRKATDDTAKSNEMLRAKTQALALAYNPVMAASMAYERTVEQLNEAHRLGVLTADQLEAKLAEVGQAYSRVGADALRATNFTNQFGTVTRVAGVKTNRFGMVAQQVGYQVGDFFVQVQSGTNAFVAFGQQATQLAGLLPGLAGAIVGIGISVGTMLLAMWDRTRNATNDSLSATQRYEDALRSLRQEAATTADEVAAVLAGYEGSSAGAILNQMRERERATAEAVESLRAQIEDERRLAAAATLPSTRETHIRGAEYLQMLLDAQLATTRQQNQEDQERLDLIRQQAEEQRRVDAVSGAARRREDDSALMQAQLNYMRQGVEMAEARTRAEEDLLLQQAMVLASAEDATEEQRAFVDRLVDSVNRARELKGQVDAIAAAAQWAATAAGRIAGAFASATAQIQNVLVDLRAAQLQNSLLSQGVAPIVAQARAEAQSFRSRLLEQMGGGATLTRNQQIEVEARVNEYYEARLALARETAQVQELGGGAAQTERQDAIAAMIEQAERQRDLIRLSEQERQVMEIFYQLQERARQQGAEYTQEQLMNAAERIAAVHREREAIEAQRQASERLAGTLSNLFMAGLEGADAFRRALANLASQLAQMLANRAFQRLLEGVGGGGGKGGGLLGRLIGLLAADGAVMQHGMPVRAFANGGVVGSPTLFPMRTGMGLMGEAGPEAIMPLRRGGDGKLGVSSRVGVDVRVYTDDNGNWQAAVERIADSRVAGAAPEIADQVARARIRQYDSTLPTRMAQVQARPRFT